MRSAIFAGVAFALLGTVASGLGVRPAERNISAAGISSFSSINADLAEGIIETLVFVDNDLAAVFNRDMNEILNYLTVYFWDLNMRLKTLPSLRLSYRVAGVYMGSASSKYGFPFIEQARVSGTKENWRLDPNGKPAFGTIMGNLETYVRDNAGRSIPNSDLVVVLVKGDMWEQDGGIQGVGDTRPGPGRAVLRDRGDWDVVATGAHEIGHAIGAPHDSDVGCGNDYIMGGSYPKRWFYSPCSDKHIGDFVRSSAGDRFRRLDAPQNYPIAPDFSLVPAPSMLEQCERTFGRGTTLLKDDCQTMTCGTWPVDKAPVDNSPCQGDGRCFRGRCRKIGKIIQNVASRLCMRAPTPSNPSVFLDMGPCPRWPSHDPLERFVVAENARGKSFATPWNSPTADENGDRCVFLYSGNNKLYTLRCDPNHDWQYFDFIDAGNGQVLLRHRPTQLCAKQIGNEIFVQSCNSNDASMRWWVELFGQ